MHGVDNLILLRIELENLGHCTQNHTTYTLVHSLAFSDCYISCMKDFMFM